MGLDHRGSAHVPALDGLRAVAVLAVIGYHYGIPGFSGGFLGVDLFFVLSGYLITSLLLREHAADGSIDIVRFWGRRVRRLLPASLLMVAAVACWGWSQVPAHQLDRLRHDLLTTLGYAANWGFISSGQSYFDASVEPSPLRHVWSLAIEEQFYAVWPLVVLVMIRVGRGRRWPLVSLVTAAAAASTAAMWTLFDAVDPSRAYYGTDTRASQLLLGALLALFATSTTGDDLGRGSRRPTARVLVGFTALAVVGTCFVVVEDSREFLYRGGFVGFATVVALLVWSLIGGDNVLARVLSWGPLTAVGAVSYGLYLWHWPVQIAVSESRTSLSGWPLTLVRLLLTVVFSLVSYRLIETPVRRRQGWGLLRAWRLPAGSLAAAGAVVALAVASTAGAVDTPRYLQGTIGDITESASPVPSPAESGGRHVLLVGDSVALSLQEAMTAEAAERGWTLSAISRSGCTITDMAPADNPCTANRTDFLARIAAAHASIIVWYSVWDGPLDFYDKDTSIIGSTTELTDSFRFLRDVDATVRLLVGPGTRVDFVIGPPPTLLAENPQLEGHIVRANRIYGAYHSLKPEHTGLLNLASVACGDGPPCPPSVDGVELRPIDGVHYGPEGAKWVARWIFDQLTASDNTATNQSSNQPR